MIAFLIFLALLLSGRPALAGSLPVGLATQVGVSIHTIIDQREFKMMANAGVRVVRLDLTWQRIETVIGRYDWEYYDRLVEGIVKEGMRPLIILGYSNSLYERPVDVRKPDSSKVWQRTAAPIRKESMDAYVKWAVAVAKRYERHAAMYEVWNEPDHAFFWPPDANPRAYVALATRACRAIKSEVPSAYIIGPGAAHVPRQGKGFPEFLEFALGSDLPQCLDGVSVHPYLDRGQIDSTPTVWSLLRARTAEVEKEGSGLDLISSEWGLSTYGGRIDEADRAAYLAKMLVLNSASGVPLSVWYNWRDNGEDGAVAENRFGLIDTSLGERPALKAVRTFSSAFSGRNVVCLRKAGERGPTAVFFKGDSADSVEVAVWGAAGARLSDAVGPIADRVSAARTAVGESLRVGSASTLRIGPMPLYLRLSRVSTTPAGLGCS